MIMPKNRIKELRKKNKITQTELAKGIGSSTQAISMYEKGERNPKIDKIQALADFFNVSVEYLMGLSDQPHVPKYETNKGVNRLPATGLSPLSEDERAEGGYIINAPKPSASDTLRNIVTMLMLDDGINDPIKRQDLLKKVYTADNATAKTVLAKIYSVLLNEF